MQKGPLIAYTIKKAQEKDPSQLCLLTCLFCQTTPSELKKAQGQENKLRNCVAVEKNGSAGKKTDMTGVQEINWKE